MKASSVLKIVKDVWDSKGPLILSVMAGVGVATTGVLAYRAGREIQDTMRREEWGTLDKEDRRDVFLGEILPEVAKPVAAGAATVGCIIGAQAKSAATIATMAGLYSMKDKEFKDLKEKAKEFLGDKDYQKLQDKMAEDKLIDTVEEAGGFKGLNVYNTNHGNTLIVDNVTGVPFRGSIEFVRQCVNDVNYDYNRGDMNTVLDFYYRLGIDAKGDLWDYIGWDPSQPTGMMELHTGSTIINDEPALSIEYNWEKLMRT